MAIKRTELDKLAALMAPETPHGQRDGFLTFYYNIIRQLIAEEIRRQDEVIAIDK